MKRNVFDNHQHWQRLDALNKAMDDLPDNLSEEERDLTDEMFLIIEYLQSFRALGPSQAFLFSSTMLDAPAQNITNATSYFNQRKQNAAANGLVQAASNQITPLVPIVGQWPRPYAKGFQAGQMNDVFVSLQERQKIERKKIGDYYDSLQGVIGEYKEEVKALKQNLEDSEKEFADTVAEVSKLVTDQQIRVDKVITDGQEAVAALPKNFHDAFNEVAASIRQERKEAVKADTATMQSKLDEAESKLEELRGKETEYANLVSAVAADTMAGHFETASKDSHNLGQKYIMTAVVLIVLAATPLIFQMFFPPSGDAWTSFAIRAAIGLILGTGATVAIRIGSRMLTEASAAKRMAMELRAFGPFLANVGEKADVDNARLELVDRAFGKSYVPATQDSKNEVVSVSGVTDIIGAISKVSGRS